MSRETLRGRAASKHLTFLILVLGLSLGVGQARADAFGFAQNDGTNYVGKTLLLTSEQLEVRTMCSNSMSLHSAILIDSNGGPAERIIVGISGTNLPHSRGDMYLVLATQVCQSDGSVIELVLRPVNNASGID